MLRKLFSAIVIVVGTLLSAFPTMRIFAHSSGMVTSGVSPGQFPNKQDFVNWQRRAFSTARWWGSFPHNLKVPANEFATYPWAVGPFTKYTGNPVLRPSHTPGAWDQGCFNNGGGVHNGAIIVKGGKFYYIYRGTRPLNDPHNRAVNYICNIGVAISKNGIHFKKDSAVSPIFRKGYRRYSYEDPDVSEYKGTYYLFCNQWDWNNMGDRKINGTFLATSKDLLHWRKIGIVFPDSRRLHRNAVVLQSPHNRAIRVHGKFVMYLDNGLVAYSKNMRHWVTRRRRLHYPGGEVCFALGNYARRHRNRIVLFTGGHFTGHYYAIGEVLFSQKNLAQPLGYLPAPVLAANPNIPYENGFSASDPTKAVSSFDDTIFFTGLTRHDGKWWIYYGGSEYYTCLATAPANTRRHDGINPK